MKSNYGDKPLKDLFKKKLNLWKDKSKKREKNFVKLLLHNTVGNKINRNCSVSRSKKIKNFLKNKNISICSNYLISNAKDEYKNRKLLSQTNRSYKSPIENKYKKFWSKLNSKENYSFLSFNKNINKLNQNEKPKSNLPLIKKINNKILYIGKSQNSLVLSDRSEASNNLRN